MLAIVDSFKHWRHCYCTVLGGILTFILLRRYLIDYTSARRQTRMKLTYGLYLLIIITTIITKLTPQNFQIFKDRSNVACSSA